MIMGADVTALMRSSCVKDAGAGILMIVLCSGKYHLRPVSNHEQLLGIEQPAKSRVHNPTVNSMSMEEAHLPQYRCQGKAQHCLKYPVSNMYQLMTRLSHTWPDLCVWVSAYVCLWVCVALSGYVSMCAYVWVCVNVWLCVCVCMHACMCSITHQRIISSSRLSTLYETGFCVTVLARLAIPKASYEFPLSASHSLPFGMC